MILPEKCEIVGHTLKIKTSSDGKKMFLREINVSESTSPDFTLVEKEIEITISVGRVVEVCETDGAKPDKDCKSELKASDHLSITKNYNQRRRTIVYELCPESPAFSIDGSRIWFEDNNGMRYYIAKLVKFPFILKNYDGHSLNLKMDKYVAKLFEEN